MDFLRQENRLRRGLFCRIGAGARFFFAHGRDFTGVSEVFDNKSAFSPISVQIPALARFRRSNFLSLNESPKGRSRSSGG
jgi:hypothetical protein